MEIEPQIEFVEREVKTAKLEVGTKPLVIKQVKITKTIVEETNV
jgi:hypothetical protein